jgi:cytochrome c peroxidase
MSPKTIKQRDLLPEGFKPLPHVKHATGGQVFPDHQIDEIQRQERRNLRRFDVDFDLPDHLHAGVPAADLPDDARRAGRRLARQLLTIKNYYELMNGISRRCRWRGCGCC